MSRSDAHRLADMVMAIDEIAAIVERGRPAFDNDVVLRRAVERCLEIIGEAAKSVSPAVTQAHPEIPWSDMAKVRDRLSHHYHRVDQGTNVLGVDFWAAAFPFNRTCSAIGCLDSVVRYSRVGIHSSARRHGVDDLDIQHAVEHSLAIEDIGEDPDRWLVIGPDRAGNLLELVVWSTGAARS